MTVGQLAREYRWAKEPQRKTVLSDATSGKDGQYVFDLDVTLTYEVFAAKIEAAFVAGWEARDAASTD